MSNKMKESLSSVMKDFESGLIEKIKCSISDTGDKAINKIKERSRSYKNSYGRRGGPKKRFYN